MSEIDQLLMELHEESLDAKGVEELKAALKTPEGRRAWVHSSMLSRDLQECLAMMPSSGEVVPTKASSQQVHMPSLSSARLKPVGYTSFRWGAWVGVAAGIAVVMLFSFVANHLGQAGSGEQIAEIAQVEGEVMVKRGTFSMRLLKNMPLRDGDEISTAERSSFAYRYTDHTLVAVGENSALQVEGAGEAKRIMLREGVLSAQVSPQLQTMQVITKDAGVEVLGTSFVFSTDTHGSQLDLLEGRVRVRNRMSDTAVMVTAGDRVESTGGELVLMSHQRKEMVQEGVVVDAGAEVLLLHIDGVEGSGDELFFLPVSQNGDRGDYLGGKVAELRRGDRVRVGYRKGARLELVDVRGVE